MHPYIRIRDWSTLEHTGLAIGEPVLETARAEVVARAALEADGALESLIAYAAVCVVEAHVCKQSKGVKV